MTPEDPIPGSDEALSQAADNLIEALKRPECVMCGQSKDRILQLESAIRKHRDQRGDDRCWIDDVELYEVLADPQQPVFKLPPRSTFLNNCVRYWECRQKSSDKDEALLAYRNKT